MPAVPCLSSRSVNRSASVSPWGAAPVLFAGCALCLAFAGCGGATDQYQSISHEDAVHAEEHGHEHVHTAPHGGHLIELGDHKYNAEVVFAGDSQQMLVYLLDAHAENPVAVAATALVFTTTAGQAIALQADPQEGDAEGHASRFVAKGGPLADVSDEEELQGTISVTIDGQEYGGALSHDHEGHDHDEHGHDTEQHPN